MAYQVVVDDDLPGFIQKVNKAIEQGWRPLGGISVAVRADGKVGYFQAMVHE